MAIFNLLSYNSFQLFLWSKPCFKMSESDVKIVYLMHKFMGNHTGHLLFVWWGRLLGVIKQVRFSVRDESPVLHGPSAKVWNSDFIYGKKSPVRSTFFPFVHDISYQFKFFGWMHFKKSKNNFSVFMNSEFPWTFSCWL